MRSTSVTTRPNTPTHTHTHPYDLYTCCPVTNELHNVACFILFPNTHSNYIVHKIALLRVSSGVGHTPSHTYTRHIHAHTIHKNQTNFVIHITSTNALIRRQQSKAASSAEPSENPSYACVCVCLYICVCVY